MFSKFKLLSATASRSKTIDELDGDKADYSIISDVASHPPRSRQAARLSVAKLQSAGACSGLETKRSAPLRGYVLVDYSSSSQSHGEIQNTKTG